ncbi:daptide biosynthesis RiPP recognition protein [Paenarthrobacter sp. NPDC089322]|uniref:daptide biosynthesis RiPP recognition protein n=1 Tax=Paenarthrobacter sp. NPDC089322 TaxID=3155065 RepID=UPI003449DDBD
MTLNEQQTIAAAVDQWITGIPGRIPGQTIFVENPEHVPYAHELADEESIVLVLNGDDGDDKVIAVAGTFDVSGEELLVGGQLSLEIQDYLAIPFISLVGVTVVRITTDDDWRAFFDDATEARRSGHFVRQLTEVNAVLAERGLLAGERIHRLARLHIAADGTIPSGPYGAKIGRAGDPMHDLQSKALALPPGSAVASVAGALDVRESLANRPWIPRYLAALDAWKFIPRDDRPDTRFVGFGLSLYGATINDDLPSPSAPFIIQQGIQFKLLDTRTGRLFKLGPDAATVIEAVSNLRDLKAAAAAVAIPLGVSKELAESSAQAVIDEFAQLGIDILGTR